MEAITYDTKGCRSIGRHFNDLRKAVRKERVQMLEWKTLSSQMKAELAGQVDGLLATIDEMERRMQERYQPTSAAPEAP